MADYTRRFIPRRKRIMVLPRQSRARKAPSGLTTILLKSFKFGWCTTPLMTNVLNASQPRRTGTNRFTCDVTLISTDAIGMFWCRISWQGKLTSSFDASPPSSPQSLKSKTRNSTAGNIIRGGYLGAVAGSKKPRQQSQSNSRSNRLPGLRGIGRLVGPKHKITVVSIVSLPYCLGFMPKTQGRGSSQKAKLSIPCGEKKVKLFFWYSIGSASWYIERHVRRIVASMSSI